MNIRELLGRIEGLKKDLEYTKNLAEKWKPQEERFPIIYEYILKQQSSFEETIEDSYKLDVKEVADKLEESGSPAAQVSEEDEAELAAPIESEAPPSADPDEADAAADKAEEDADTES
ncbi:MAG: hypothetical protein E3J72_06210 [Planctomycetota bacterium]|nr:MAG: hypothetical protein E3J72_06210 [Planctomycetota bacterium]